MEFDQGTRCSLRMWYTTDMASGARSAEMVAVQCETDDSAHTKERPGSPTDVEHGGKAK